MQPLLISTRRSSARLRLTSRCTSLASMLISLMSLTITATRRFSRFFSTWLSRVLLPAPRKPESRVTGSRAVMGFSGSGWAARAAALSGVAPVALALFLALLAPRCTARRWGAAAGRRRPMGSPVSRHQPYSPRPAVRGRRRSCPAASFPAQGAAVATGAVPRGWRYRRHHWPVAFRAAHRFPRLCGCAGRRARSAASTEIRLLGVVHVALGGLGEQFLLAEGKSGMGRFA